MRALPEDFTSCTRTLLERSNREQLILLLEAILYFSPFLVIWNKDGAVDVENLRMGDKIDSDKESTHSSFC